MKSSLLSISAIGNRGHAKSVIDIINKSSIAKVECIYKPNTKNRSDLETSDIEKILDSDAVFILSPNDTHFRYLKYLKKNYKGYIYCEKPPVIKINHLKLIEKYSKKIFFNFNLRFSILESLISEINTNEKIVKINFTDCHGLAYKKDIYSKSWI